MRALGTARYIREILAQLLSALQVCCGNPHPLVAPPVLHMAFTVGDLHSSAMRSESFTEI